MSSLCRIKTRIPRAPDDIVAGFKDIPSSIASDAFRKTGAMRGIVPIPYPGVPVAGSAVTVRTRAQDNVLPHKAMDLARPGDVIVIAAGGYPDCGIIGELMAAYAMSRGISGFVVDGMVRDSDFFARTGFPVYALGTSPRGPYRTAEGEVNFPVVAAGVTVNPGDLIVGDADGVTVIPREEAGEVLTACRQLLDQERKTLATIEDGSNDRSWIDRLLEERGVQIEE